MIAVTPLIAKYNTMVTRDDVVHHIMEACYVQKL